MSLLKTMKIKRKISFETTNRSTHRSCSTKKLFLKIFKIHMEFSFNKIFFLLKERLVLR